MPPHWVPELRLGGGACGYLPASMRDYSKVSPQFWIGTTGRKIREAGRDAQVVAMYLITGPSANMIGLYYLSLPTLCHEIGSPLEGARKALRRVVEAEFALYDEPSETVFVPEMAKFQIGRTLTRTDNRWKAVVKELSSAKPVQFAKHFHDKYRICYNLPEMTFGDSSEGVYASPSEAPPEPLRSQNQNQNQNQNQEQKEATTARTAGTPRPSRVIAQPNSGVRQVLDAYHAAFIAQNGGEKPNITGKDAALAKQLVARHGTEKVLVVLARMFETTDVFIANSGRTIGILSSQWNKLVASQPASLARRLWEEAEHEQGR